MRLEEKAFQFYSTLPLRFNMKPVCVQMITVSKRLTSIGLNDYSCVCARAHTLALMFARTSDGMSEIVCVHVSDYQCKGTVSFVCARKKPHIPFPGIFDNYIQDRWRQTGLLTEV